MQRKDQVLHKIPAPIQHSQTDGEEEHVHQLKERGIVLPMLIDLVKQSVFGHVSFGRAAFELVGKGLGLRVGGGNEANVIQRDSRARIEKQI